MSQTDNKTLKTLADACNQRQRMFAEAYAECGVATQAAIVAGYSKKTAHVQGDRLLSNAKVAAYLAALQAKATGAAGIRVEDVMRELGVIGFADMAEFAEWDGEGVRLIPSVELDDLRRRAIVEVKQTRNGVSIKLADKVSALDRLGKALGMFVDVVEHNINFSETLKRRRERAREARASK